MTKELFNKIKNSGMDVVEYVIQNYWEMDKEDLRDCVSEVGWVAVRNLSEDDAIRFNEQVLESLEENRVDDED